MWSLSILILISIGGALSDSCYEKVKEHCDYDLLPSSFARNEEDLLEICKNVQTYGDCVADVKQTCDEEEQDMGESIRKAVEYLRSVCTEDDPNFKVISNKLQCIERVFNYLLEENCFDVFSNKSVQILKKRISEKIDDDHSGLANCLWDAMRVSCEVVTYGHNCGEDVKVAIGELLAHIHADIACHNYDTQELAPILELFEAILEEELELKNALKKRK